MTGLSCAGIALAIYLVLALIGVPIWLLVRPTSPPISDAFACPLLGLAVVQVFSWYWLRYVGSGMARGLPILVACALVSLAGVGWAKRETLHSPSVARSVSTVATLAAVAVVFTCEFRVPLGVGHLTSGSIYNADIALYVNVAAGLVSHGFGWAGNIVGTNLGVVATNAQGIGPGVYSTLAAAAAGTGMGTWQVALPLLLVGVALGALAVRDAALLLLPRSLVAAPVIAVLTTMASLFGYVTTNYFLAQVLVMPLALGELLVLHWIARQPTWRERVAGLALVAAVVVSATLSYTPMAFAMQPVLLGVVFLGEVGRGWLRRSAELVVSTLGAFVAAYALVPTPFTRSAEFLRVALGSHTGWPFGLLTPLDLLGFRQAVRAPRHVVGMFVLEAAFVGGVVLVAVWALSGERRRAAIFHAAAAFVVLASYAAAYANRGYSYEQWKWISFFQPMFMGAVFALVAAAAGALISRWPPAHQTSGRVVAGLLGVVLLAASARILEKGTQHTRAVWGKGEPLIAWSVVGSRLSELGQNAPLTHLKAVNIDLPKWDEMWAAYFLQPTMRVYLVRPSYFPVSAPGASWTLVSEADSGTPTGDAQVHYIVVKGGPRP